MQIHGPHPDLWNQTLGKGPGPSVFDGVIHQVLGEALCK